MSRQVTWWCPLLYSSAVEMAHIHLSFLLPFSHFIYSKMVSSGYLLFLEFPLCFQSSFLGLLPLASRSSQPQCSFSGPAFSTPSLGLPTCWVLLLVWVRKCLTPVLHACTECGSLTMNHRVTRLDVSPNLRFLRQHLVTSQGLWCSKTGTLQKWREGEIWNDILSPACLRKKEKGCRNGLF